MPYGDVAKIIGFCRPEDTWQDVHFRLEKELIALAAAAEQQGKDGPALDWNRFVNAATGLPGNGVTRTPRIMEER
jgi:hypothetical protein